jgi:hypothetical protein
VPALWLLSGTLRLPAGADSVRVPLAPTPAALTLTVRSQPLPGVSVQRDCETCQAPLPLVTDASTMIGWPDCARRGVRAVRSRHGLSPPGCLFSSGSVARVITSVVGHAAVALAGPG